MRIEHIRLHNLNSLVGTWEIDLTAPAYRDDNLYAITGPTGAGKTTILDAICLALYGRTPRLARINKNTNDIMSRHTGTCFAEATIAVHDRRYRCHWSQHRARRRADGELQNPKHEIADATSGQLLASSLKTTAATIEQLTGMDYSRFTRAMLLAQGEFAAYLQATPDERAPLLEQITGTAIYSQLSIRAHENYKPARDTLNTLQAETAGITLLTADETAALEAERDTARHAAATLATTQQQTAAALAWLADIARLRAEHSALREQAAQLAAEAAAFAPERARLERANRAATLDAAYTHLNTLRQQQHDDEHSLATLSAALPGQQSALAAADTALASAQAALAAARQQHDANQPHWQNMRTCDQRLADQQHTLREHEQRVATTQADLTNAAARHSTLQQQHDDETRQLTACAAWLDIHAADAALARDLNTITLRVQDLAAQQKQNDETAAHTRATLARHQKNERALAAAETACQKTAAHAATLAAAHDRANQRLTQHLAGRSLRDYRADKDRLAAQLAAAQNIADLATRRAQLHDGEPCPLCGATEHPYTHGQTPQPDSLRAQYDALNRYITEAETCENEEHNAASAARTAAQNATAAAHNRDLAAQNYANSRANHDAARQQQKQSDEALAAARATLAQQLASYTPTTATTPHNPAAILETLRQRLHDWQTHTKKHTDLQQQHAATAAALAAAQATLTACENAHNQATTACNAALTACQTTQNERRTHYGTRDPDAEARAAQHTITRSEHDAQRTQTARQQAHDTLRDSETRLHDLRQRLTQNSAAISEAAAQFQKDSEAAGNIADATEQNTGWTLAQQTQTTETTPSGTRTAITPAETAYLAARLPAAARAQLAARAADLDRRQQDNHSRLHDRAARLNATLAQALTDEDETTLRERQETARAQQQTHDQTIATLNYRLAENQKAHVALRDKQAAITAQQADTRRWQALHDLIGSADGKKYRNFAQGLTFASVIAHANRQLARMNDRYLLTHDPARPLELDIIDNYQGGETRTTKNLSGGETFLVSLALALGLSHMAGENIRIDTLFLDEGFGTLDEETLESALDTLSALRADGKHIGVISHIAALTERIPTQIRITPEQGGRSRIDGPGCHRGD
ncbi:AAA family ATPase [Cardiobacterium valvarum]|uniref:Exonuclease SbcCD, C subunit n=1 Tax=Cardiobacterium valvarum F0432 TaxID=797473 RepID=G9ZJH6_9GAMM|nr:AAA family ATPase [Cardiobacterium valvarum]EHM49754.1 exonuclease SbcCD, C subunit [Cardiobacterium valvarum F0432]